MGTFIDESELEPYDCVYQAWAIIAFAHPDKNKIDYMPDVFPYVCAVYDSKDFAIEIAETMRRNGLAKENKDYHFIVQGVPVNGYYPILGLSKEVSINGNLKNADRTEILI